MIVGNTNSLIKVTTSETLAEIVSAMEFVCTLNDEDVSSGVRPYLVSILGGIEHINETLAINK